MTMLDLGNYARLQKPYAARRLALERCIERETNATKTLRVLSMRSPASPNTINCLAP